MSISRAHRVTMSLVLLLLLLLWSACGLRGVDCRENNDCTGGKVCVQGWCLKKKTSFESGNSREVVWDGDASTEDIPETSFPEPAQPEHRPVCEEGSSRSCFGGDKTLVGRGVCKPGRSVCKNGVWTACVGQQLPRMERCNGLDDDCDGQVDEGCHTCLPTQVTASLGRPATAESFAVWWLNSSLLLRVSFSKVEIWNAKTGMLDKTSFPKLPTRGIHFVARHAGSGKVAVFSQSLQIFSASGVLLKSTAFPTTGASSFGRVRVVWGHRGEWLFVANGSGVLWRWEQKSGNWTEVKWDKKDFPRSTFVNLLASHPTQSLLTMTISNKVILWEPQTQKILRTLPVLYTVEVLEPFHGGESWLVVERSGRIRWWKNSDGQVRTISGTTSSIRAVPGQNAWMTWNRQRSSLELYDADSRALLQSLKLCHSSKPWAILKHSTPLLASACTTGQMQVVSLRPLGLLKSFPSLPVGHNDVITTLAFGAKGQWLLSGSKDRTLRLWDFSSGKPASIMAGISSIPTVSTRLGQYWVVGQQSGEVFFHNLQNLRAEKKMSLCNKPITALLAVGNRLVVGCEDGTLQVRQGETILLHKSLPEPVRDLREGWEKKGFWVALHNGKVGFWSWKSLKTPQWWQTSSETLRSMEVSQTGLLLLSYKGALEWWRWPEKELKHVFSRLLGQPARLLRRPRSRQLFLYQRDSLYAWSLQEEKLLKKWRGSHSSISTFAFSPDGSRMAFADQNRQLFMMTCPKE